MQGRNQSVNPMHTISKRFQTAEITFESRDQSNLELILKSCMQLGIDLSS